MLATSSSCRATAAVALAACCLLATSAVWCDLNVAAQWHKTDLRPLADETRDAENVPENNLAYRLRVWADTAYVAFPRFRRGVPATLCATPTRGDGGPLRPFPSLGLQTLGNCYGLQNAVDIEIDHLGQLWTLDRGRAATRAAGDDSPERQQQQQRQNDVQCDPKLFVVDTGSRRLVRSAVIPPTMYTDRSVLSGLAIDLKSLTAIVADLGPDQPGFIAYDFPSGIYHKFRCTTLVKRLRRPRRSESDKSASAGADKDDEDDDYDEALLAASPIDDQLYFTAIGLDAVYAIPLSVFSAPPLYGRDVSHYVSARGPLNGTATAAIMDTAGNLYLAMRDRHKVIAWNTLRRGFDVAEPAVLEIRLDWVSGLAFDARGYLWIVTSAFRDFARAGAAANAKIFRRYSGTTAFALQEAAANATTADDDNDNESNQQSVRNTAAVHFPVFSVVCCTVVVLLRNLKTA